MAGGEYHVDEDNEIGGRDLIMLARGHSTLDHGPRVVLGLLLEEEAHCLDPLDFEDAVVPNVSDLPQAGGVGHTHDPDEVLLLHHVQDLEVPVVSVCVAERADLLVRWSAREAGAPHMLDGMGEDLRGDAA